MIIKNSFKPLRGALQVPGDKSISHRSVMLGALAYGETRVQGFLNAEDCQATIALFRSLGVLIEQQGSELVIHGQGLASFQPVTTPIDVGNSGTTMRLAAGILAATSFTTRLTGDASLHKRPMDRVIMPLKQMGADLHGKQETGFPPLTINGQKLRGIHYQLPVASAQVKSALLLAALHAEGPTTLREKELTRNHTETMVAQFGGEISIVGKEITLVGPQKLVGTKVVVPGDISSAAFFMVAALIIPDSYVTLTNVGLTKTRAGIIEVIEEMHGKLTVSDVDTTNHSATITVATSQLQATEISGEIIPRLIDELPIIALLATQATGRTVIRNAEELKVKETNRIDVTAQELRKLGCQIETTADGLIIEGNQVLHGGVVDSHGDHRIGMMLAIAAELTDEVVEIKQSEAVAVSYPNFFTDLVSLKERVV